MTDSTQRPGRRGSALSKDRIVQAAISILDNEGAAGLTFRALAGRLKTGSGAIYWHVADKDELLAAATDHVIAKFEPQDVGRLSPQEAIRALALGVFDAIDSHPWVGAQLSGNPFQYAVLRILEGLGTQVVALGIPEKGRFNAATALLSFMLGLAAQYAVASHHFRDGSDRTTALRAVAAKWMELDPEQHPFIHQVAPLLPVHDDREQFMAGIDLILAGIDTSR
ncbi:TetR family transcriptional regulator [Phyllobacterium phragmitis]|uniref:TetR family transcriptional regulator n=1 Tax=Phyllobacterium phragmitis TaxID=2670329 RepID=A0A2S9IRQ5_9HYPH|nr:TetR family transcriptional regulator [Phyllobacterium phragmitis]PRD43197.1 TetR family transcriptional regulator [Phyllobacterium phragmitis]